MLRLGGVDPSDVVYSCNVANALKSGDELEQFEALTWLLGSQHTVTRTITRLGGFSPALADED